MFKILYEAHKGTRQIERTTQEEYAQCIKVCGEKKNKGSAGSRKLKYMA